MGYFIGLDLGGTNIKSGVVDDTGRVLAQDSVPTPGNDGPEVIMRTMADSAGRVAKLAKLRMDQIDAIGIGSPGPMDMKNGIVLATPNMKGFTNVPLRDRIKDLTGRPTALENDANAAGFGEFFAGAGKDSGVTDLVMLTLGTGIGSGIVIEGKVLHGAFGLGGEAGHMIVVPNGRLCGCGQMGCIEAYASATQTANRATEAVRAAKAEGASGGMSSLASLVTNTESRITAKDVFDAAAKGDALAGKVADETGELLGLACVTLCRILDPQMIVFAGGMIAAGEQLFGRIRRSFEKHTWKLIPSPAKIVPAQLGNDAGFIGAAAVAWDAKKRGVI